MPKEGNKNAFKHGAAAGEKALEKGKPFTGLAAAVENEVQAELQDAGPAAILEKQAARLETVSRLYYDAFVASIQAGDLAKADTYAARYGWLANSSIRAWDTVQRSQKNTAKHGPDVVLNAISTDEGSENGNE